MPDVTEKVSELEQIMMKLAFDPNKKEFTQDLSHLTIDYYGKT